nr:reverse transcriptase domain-containing protein [Tanacetum cinerariifolium]
GLQLTHASCAESCNGSQFTIDAIQELASPEANGFCDSPLLGVNIPRSDEDRLKLIELMVFLLQKDVCDDIGITAARLSNYCYQANVSVVWLLRWVGKGFSRVETPLFEGMITDRQPAEEELGAEKVQVDVAVAAAAVEDVVEDVAEDVAHVATPLPPPHGIPSPPQEPSSPPQQPHVTPLAPTQGEPFPATFQQRFEIVKLKAKVKKLEQTDKVKSSKFWRLRKVGASRQVESSDDMEDVFNQGRMINEDEGIKLVKDAEIAESEGRQADKQAEIYNIDLDHSSKVLISAVSTTIPAASATIPTAKPSIPTATPTVVVTYTRRRKGVTIRGPEEELPFKTPDETPKVKDKGKGILVEAPNPIKKKDQIEMDAKYARKLQEEIDSNHDGFNKDVYWDAAMDHVIQKSSKEMEAKDQEIIKSINETPVQKAAKRRKLSEEAQEAEDLKKRLEVVDDEDDDVFVEATPLASKVPVVDYQIVLIDNKPRYKIIRADDTHQLYISFTTLLKNFDRENLETVWRIVKDRLSTSKPTNFLDEYLLLTLKTMFEEPDGQDAIWRNKKSVHGLALVLDTYSSLVRRIEGLEHDKVAQQLEIVKLKARVKKLEKLNKIKSSKLRRLRKVGTSQRVESSDDEENVFNQGRIKIYNIDLDHYLKVLSMQEDDTEVQEAVEVVTTAKLITEVVTAATTQVVAASTPITAANPKVLKIAAAAPAVSTKKRKGVVIRDPEEELHTETPAETLTVKDKGKGILIEDPKPIKKKDQRYHGIKKKPQTESEARKNMISYLRNTKGYKMEFFKGLKYDDILPIFQARFDANLKFLFKSREEMEKEDEEIIKSINETPAQKVVKRRRLHEQAKEDEDLKKQLEVVVDEDDDVFIEATPIGKMVHVVNYEIVMINNKPRYKIIRADDTHQLYTSFITLLKNFDRENLEDLWKIVKARFSTLKPTNFSDDYLLSTLKTMFEKIDGQDALWKNQQTVYGQALIKTKSDKSSIDEPPEVELKDLPPHIEYAFLEGDDKLLVIIMKDLSVEEKTTLITVLKSHKRATAWKLFDIKGIDPEVYTHKILMKEDFEPTVQHQRRVNPKIHDVIKNEVHKLLDAGLIYPISDSPWVSPVHCVSKKGGFTVVKNEENELILTRLVTIWRVCIDYRKLNEATRKDHFPLPFMDQMLERLAGNQYYCFLDGFSGYFQIPIDPKDQEKTTFTCPYGTFAYRRMPFGLCNAPGTFQRTPPLSTSHPPTRTPPYRTPHPHPRIGWEESEKLKFLVFFDVIASGNPTPYYDSIVSTTSPTLTLFGNSDFLLEDVNAFLALEDDPTSPKVDKSYELKICEAKSDKSSIDEPPEVELKDLPPHLEYAFLEGDDKLLVIIMKDLSVKEKTALITVLKSHKRATAWKLSDIKGIDPEVYTHKILMKEDFKPTVQHQRRVNPKIHDVIKNEVHKLLDAGLIYPISDSPWVSPVHCVSKKGGFTVVKNEENELILTRLVTIWRVCIDYHKLNEATRNDHFPLPFMDQMLERLAGNQYYCFLDGFSGYFQIPIDPKDQEKTIFTCPYGTFAYRRMSFGLCNAPGTFQRCMMAIFHDMIEKLWKSSWMTSQFLGILFKSVSPI